MVHPISWEKKSFLACLLHAVMQRLPGVLFILGALLLFLGPIFINSLYWVVVFIMTIFLATNAVRLVMGLMVAVFKVPIFVKTDWVLMHSTAVAKCIERSQIPPLPIEKLSHLIVIPNYKEEYETLCETLDTLAYHDTALGCVLLLVFFTFKVILAMEAGESGCEEKARKLVASFGHRFVQIFVTIHPSNIPGESRGKSSNVAWATSFYNQHLCQPDDARFEIITVIDADTHLSQKYFECVNYYYSKATPEQQEKAIFAPTLMFDRNANEVPVFVRLADICWSMGLLANFNMPVAFPCSVYSVSMMLAKNVDFWDSGPEAIGEDVHMALKCWTAHYMSIYFQPIYIPASCSCVQADTYFKSILARFQQSKRHLWALLDLGFTISSVMLRQCWLYAPVNSTLCVYFLFEIFFQPFFGFYQLPGQFIFPQSHAFGIGALVLSITNYIRLALIPCALLIVINYEIYHSTACAFRAANLERMAAKKREEMLVLHSLETSLDPSATPSVAASSFLIKHSVAFRKWYHVVDWLFTPVPLVIFYAIPAIMAMLAQLVTNKLDYQVSLKPTTRTIYKQPTEPTPTDIMDSSQFISASDSDEADAQAALNSSSQHALVKSKHDHVSGVPAAVDAELIYVAV